MDIILLIDASSSAKTALDSVKDDLIKFVRNVTSTYNVGIGIYGSEEKFDASGFSVLQTMTSNAENAVQALQNIPVFPDGPRTSIQALSALLGERNVPGASEKFGFLSRERAFILVGNSPGREIPCDAPYFTDIRQSLSRDPIPPFTTHRIMTASIGTPGLNSALPSLHCDNYNIPEARDPIAEGQAAAISDPDGEVQTPLTFDKLYATFDRNRRLPFGGYAPAPGEAWGRRVWVTQNTTGREFPFFQMPFPVPQSDGCNERVRLTTPVPWAVPHQIPTDQVGKIRLSLAPGGCSNGRFTCEVVIKDSRVGHFSSPSSFLSILDGHVHIVKVNALC
ncbi:von Willebrand factor A-like protein [Gracilaria domingensis]|nr:von Willebrand factor A-like protein [Gracilaria domingensis]